MRKANVKMQISFNRRFDANFARVRQSIVSGEIGTPHLMHIISRDPVRHHSCVHPACFSTTIHDFDMARFLIGDEVTEVYASAGVRVDPEIGKAGDIDTAVILLRYANGVISTIDNCRQAPMELAISVSKCSAAKARLRRRTCIPIAAMSDKAESVRRDLPLNFFMEALPHSARTARLCHCRGERHRNAGYGSQ
ncbi:MAG: Gfo/Idh/MocA family oxidoreductase [Bryobacteraceae bacterium]